MTKEVYLEYEERRSGGEPLGDGPYCDHADEHVDFRPIALGVNRSQYSWRNETISVDFDPKVGQDVDMIVVRYSTGSTFGRIIGVWQMIGVYESHQEALRIRHNIEEHHKEPDKLKELLGKDFYPSWLGYFERFMHVELHCMRLRD
jgi:hypothetical protein